MSEMINRLIITSIVAYQQIFFSHRLFPRCKYHPSCSEYTIEAIKKHGAICGLVKGFCRIVRCNPLAKGGVDLP